MCACVFMQVWVWVCVSVCEDRAGERMRISEVALSNDKETLRHNKWLRTTILQSNSKDLHSFNDAESSTGPKQREGLIDYLRPYKHLMILKLY